MTKNGILSHLSEISIYKQFEDFLKIRYDGELLDEEQKIDNFENIFMMGLRQAQKYLDQNKSCDLLFQDKPPRSDMIVKLGNILWELENTISFPVVPPLKIRAAIKKVLSSRDERTQKRYLEWILQYAIQNREFNSIDLTYLVKKFPIHKIQQGDIW